MLIRRTRYRNPTSESRLDTNHPLIQGMAGYFPMFECGGLNTIDLLNRKVAAFGGVTKPTWNAAGNITQGTAGFLDAGSGAGPLASLALGPASFHYRIKSRVNDSSQSFGLGARNDGNTVNAGWQIEQSSGFIRLIIEKSSVNMTSALGTGTMNLFDGKWHDFFVTFDNLYTATSTWFYLDTSLASNVSATGSSGTIGADTSFNFFIGKAVFNSGIFDGDIALATFWKRVLQPSEIQQYVANPYKLIYRPISYFPLGGAVSVDLTFSDALALSDQSSLSAGIVGNFSETLALSDSLGTTMADLIGLSDTFTFSDAIIVSSSDNFFVTVSDAIAFSDAVFVNVAGGIDVSDTIALSDAVALLEACFINKSDALAFTDFMHLDVPVKIVISGDFILFTDSLMQKVFLLIAKSDSIALSDSVLAQLSGATDFTDSVALTDLAAVRLGLNVSFSDVIALSDLIKLNVNYALAFSDAISLSDSVAISGRPVASFNDYIRRYLNDVIN